jgi:hypothetical protein
MDGDNGESGRDGSGESAGRAAAEGSGRGTRGRFRKGVSGNPAGRPGWGKRSGAPGDRLIGADEPTRALILAEAYRPARLTRNGRIADEDEEQLPVNQAIIRAMARAALSGSRLAQHRWTQIVREAEREQRAAQVVIYNALEREHYRRDPKASYEDDLVFDPTAGTVLVRGDDADGCGEDEVST